MCFTLSDRSTRVAGLWPLPDPISGIPGAAPWDGSEEFANSSEEMSLPNGFATPIALMATALVQNLSGRGAVSADIVKISYARKRRWGGRDTTGAICRRVWRIPAPPAHRPGA